MDVSITQSAALNLLSQNAIGLSETSQSYCQCELRYKVMFWYTDSTGFLPQITRILSSTEMDHSLWRMANQVLHQLASDVGG